MAAALAVALGLLGTVAAAGATRDCPDPRTCARYGLIKARWPAVRGAVTIEFYVNPTQPWVAEDQAIAAIRRAAQTWMNADRAIRFVYKGETRLPSMGDDGLNVVSWGPVAANNSAVVNLQTRGSRLTEADLIFNVTLPWTWTPCSQRDGSCTRVPPRDGIAYLELQAVATHEFGHWLSLNDLSEPASRDLTMYTRVQPGERKQATPGLGDVLGVRAAYRCVICSAPRIYAP